MADVLMLMIVACTTLGALALMVAAVVLLFQ